jgi:hypothetical protein
LPSDIAIEIDPVPLPKLKFSSTGSTKPKNGSTNNELSSKPSVSSKSSELRVRAKTTRSAATEAHQSESNHVEKITRGIQQISIAPNLSKKTLRSKTSTLVPENKQALPLGEQINVAMKTVNISLSKLSAIRQTGWKADPIFVHSKTVSKETSNSVSDNQLEDALEAINQGYLATQTLRKLISNSTFTAKSYDVERAGLALVNHAIELKLVRPPCLFLYLCQNH